MAALRCRWWWRRLGECESVEMVRRVMNERESVIEVINTAEEGQKGDVDRMFNFDIAIIYYHRCVLCWHLNFYVRFNTPKIYCR